MDGHPTSGTNTNFRALFNGAPDCYLVVDPQFVVVGMSDACADAIPAPRSAIVGRNVFAAFPDIPASAEQWLRALRASLRRVSQTLKPHTMPLERYEARGDGVKVRFRRCRNVPILGPDGHLDYIIHRIEDVTASVRLKQQGSGRKRLNRTLRAAAARMEAEVAARAHQASEASAQLKHANEELARLNVEANVKLRRLEESFRATFEQAAVGIAHVAPNGRWLRVNRKLCDIVGYPREDLLRLSFQEISWPEDLDANLALAGEVLAGTRETFSIEKRYIHRAGHLLWVNATISLVRDEAGNPDYFIAVVEDIQKRKEAELALEDEREVFRNLTNIASDHFWELDEHFRFKTVSKSIVHSGLDLADYIGKACWDLPFISLSEETRRTLEATAKAHRPFRSVELGLLDRQGETCWLVVSGDPVFARNGEFSGYRGTTRDISERKRTEVRLRQQAMVFNCTEEGVVITDPQGCVIDANPAFERITENSLAEIRGQNMRFVQSGRQDRSFYREMWQSIQETGNWQGEIWNRRKSGDTYLAWLSISSVYDEAGRISNYVGVFIDLNRMKHPKSELERLALHDALTSLPNRVQLLDRLEHAVKGAKRRNGSGAVLFIDLDRFKPVNDTLGHRAGDELLMAVAARLKERLREADTLARLGGDEFVIVLEDIPNAEGVRSVAEEVILQLETPFVLEDGHEVRIGGSIGIALFPQDGETPARLLERADRALYEAKASGRGAYRHFDSLAAT